MSQTFITGVHLDKFNHKFISADEHVLLNSLLTTVQLLRIWN